MIQNAKTGADLFALPLTGDPKPFSVLQTAFEEAAAQFSPDGRWIAYESNESGRFEIYVQPFPGPGSKVQVSTAGGTQARWNRDGSELFYVAVDRRLMRVAVSAPTQARTIGVSSPVALFQTRLANGAGIFTIGGAQRPQYAVAADGRFLMNLTVGEGQLPPITIVLNWTASPKP